MFITATDADTKGVVGFDPTRVGYFYTRPRGPDMVEFHIFLDIGDKPALVHFSLPAEEATSFSDLLVQAIHESKK